MKSITRQVYEYLDGCESLDFSGWSLYERMACATGRHTYPSTLLKMVRNYCDITGATLTCVDRAKSKYHYERNIVLGGAFVDR